MAPIPSTPGRTAATLQQTRFRPGIASWISRHAVRTPDKPAIMMTDCAMTYGELDRRIWQVARLLREQGIKAGDRVSVLHENGLQFMPAVLAILRIGAVYVPLNPRLTASEMAGLISDSEPRLLITQAKFVNRLPAILGDADDVLAVVTDSMPPGSGERAILWPAPDADSSPFNIMDFDDDTAAGIFYTSGTTGLPKGAIITHANIRAVATQLAVDIGFTRTDRPLVSLPMSVSGAMLAGVLPFLHLGCTLRVLEQPSPELIISAIRRFRPTYMASVPTVYKSLLDHPDFADVDLSCFTRVLSAAAPMPVALIERFQDRGLSVFIQGFGMTETCGFTTCLMPEDAVSRAGSIGKPLLYSDARIFNGSLEAAPGETGELCVSGPAVMAGYWRRKDLQPIVDGWLRTGDLGYADEDGYLYLNGRLKDLIISGGYNVHPAEVEEVLYQLPQIAEAAVVGLPDEHWGERIVAVVRPRPPQGDGLTSQQVLDHCSARLADYKRPKEVVMVRDPLPVNPTGKLVKTRIRDALAQGALG
jgi:fatty-acyl-CoA synthase